MRIVHIVTLVSPGGEYGGPLRVALNDAAALSAQGHEVVVAAATRGYAVAPSSFEGTDLQLFPARTLVPRTGFAGLTSPGLHRWLTRNLHSFDVAHVHLARDLVTLPSAALLALRSKLPFVLQTHGMIDHSSRRLAKILDRLMTRPVLARTGAILYLTELERSQLIEVGAPPSLLRLLHNGVPRYEPATRPERQREVLFLGRLHERKRPCEFVTSALRLSARHPDWLFTLVGPDEGEASEVQRLIERSGSSKVRWEGPMDMTGTANRMARASIYVLPSVDEPYPMTVLEAMSVGTPVVITHSNGLADAVTSSKSGVVCGTGPHDLDGAIESLIEDGATRHSAGINARQVAENEFSIAAVAQRLSELYDLQRPGDRAPA